LSALSAAVVNLEASAVSGVAFTRNYKVVAY
jgi:hypothetical protein